MAKISPLLQNQIEGKNHDRIYRTLTRHANDVKPNEPKAKLIKENFVQSAVSAVKDTYTDGKNFFKATKTGKMNDNNLGRINDLGMKAGALLIATYLATHAKTKTDAIMQFIGGTTFFASMALWPKLFINLPARLAHGFRIDHKYLSAQGDKKDLGLDNQFQPMDIFTDEEMMKMAQNAGIDPNDEFAREKMQRKLQKTMLQNRTLWMATAGFATPLMTSIIGDAVTPLVRNGVVKHGYNKVNKLVNDPEGFKKYLENAKRFTAMVYDEELKKYVPVTKKLDEMLSKANTGYIDDAFYKELTHTMNLGRILTQFKDPDDTKAIMKFKSKGLINLLKQMREDDSYITKNALVESVANLPKQKEKRQLNLLGALGRAEQGVIGKEEADELLKGIDGNLSVTDVRRLLKSKNFSNSQITAVLKTAETDNTLFVTKIKEYSTETLAPLMNRFKAYMDLYNPIIGSKSESVYTNEYRSIMKNIFDKLEIYDKEYDRYFGNKVGELPIEERRKFLRIQQNFLTKKMQRYTAGNPDYIKDFTGKTMEELVQQLGEAHPDAKYNKFTEVIGQYIENKGAKDAKQQFKDALTELFGKDFYLVKDGKEFENFANFIKKDDEVWKTQIMRSYIESPMYQGILRKFYGDSGNKENLADILSTSESIKRLEDFKGNKLKDVTRALLGGGDDEKLGLTRTLKHFTNNKRIDLSAIRMKPILAANFEKRFANKEFADLPASEIQYLRDVVYNGTIGLLADPAQIPAGRKNELWTRLFNQDAFKDEEKIVPEMRRILDRLRNLGMNEAKSEEDYLASVSFTELVKKYGTEAFENKAWRRIFFPMALGLVAVTLLVQPLFGKIEKEFSKKSKKEEVHNGN